MLTPKQVFAINKQVADIKMRLRKDKSLNDSEKNKLYAKMQRLQRTAIDNLEAITVDD